MSRKYFTFYIIPLESLNAGENNHINYDVIIDLAQKNLLWNHLLDLYLKGIWKLHIKTMRKYCIVLLHRTLCRLSRNEKLRCIIIFYVFSDLPPISTNPYVNVSLEYSDRPGNKTVEPVFKCLFDEPTSGPYWYDTYWYINTDVVKLVASHPFMSNQSSLYPKDWVDMYNLNMVVRHFYIYIFWVVLNI